MCIPSPLGCCEGKGGPVVIVGHSAGPRLSAAPSPLCVPRTSPSFARWAAALLATASSAIFSLARPFLPQGAALDVEVRLMAVVLGGATAHPVLDLRRHGEEGLFDVGGVFRTGL